MGLFGANADAIGLATATGSQIDVRESKDSERALGVYFRALSLGNAAGDSLKKNGSL